MKYSLLFFGLDLYILKFSFCNLDQHDINRFNILSKGGKIKVSSNTFTNIEATFTEYFSGLIFNSELEKKIGSLLSHHKFTGDPKSFKVYVVDYGNEPFRGMSILPNNFNGLPDALACVGEDDDKVPSYKELYKKWVTIPDWSIEIDQRVFDKSYIQLNSRELTAMLIHEIGHTIFSDRKFEAFYRMYREVRLKYSVTQKAFLLRSFHSLHF